LNSNRVRIVGGRWKGRQLGVPDGARPTSGRAREALFSILRDSLSGARVLDLYAGSGALGLEALSRGASRVVFVEDRPAALDRSLERIGVSQAEAEVLRGDVPEALRTLLRRGDRFDLMFSDPPYGSPSELLVPPGASGLLTPGGLFILQVDRPAGPPPEPAGWSLVQRRDYGRNVFLFLTPVSSCFGVPF
jgi:16S rRNA (guanine966-N2)-methyltransferase